MIHVEIASEVTADGVRGVRWVLIEAASPLPAEADPAADLGADTGPAAPVAEGPSPTGDSEPVADSLRLWLLKALVVALGLGAAFWTASVQIGPPGRQMPAGPGAASTPMPPATTPPRTPAPAPAHAAPAVPAAPQTAADVPAAMPGAPSHPPARPASASLPRLTALL